MMCDFGVVRRDFGVVVEKGVILGSGSVDV